MKKLGGLRGTVRPAPERSLSDERPAKTLGGVKAGVVDRTSSAAFLECDACEGVFIKETWIHEPQCPRTVTLWKGHGFTKEDWWQVCECDPLETPGGYTHAWDCGFWDDPDRYTSADVFVPF